MNQNRNKVARSLRSATCRPGLVILVVRSTNTHARTASEMPYVMVDIESDGPIPGDFSMICFGAVIVEPGLERAFYGQLKPISDAFIPDALAVSGFSREQCLEFDDPKSVMEEFRNWLKSNCKGRFMLERTTDEDKPRSVPLRSNRDPRGRSR